MSQLKADMKRQEETIANLRAQVQKARRQSGDLLRDIPRGGNEDPSQGNLRLRFKAAGET